jgi:uncharacterized protein (DUF1501 family)
MNRRSFIRIGLGASLAALTGRPRAAHAAVADPVVVQVFLRGGVDALSVLPVASGTNRTTYVAGRPTIQVATPATVTNSLGLGIHPALVRMRALYEAGEVAFVLGAGCVNQTRSHFEQEAFIEGGDPATRQPTGYLNRALAALGTSGELCQAFAIQDTMPLSLRGPSAAIRVPALDTFGKLPASGITAATAFTDRAGELLIPPLGINPTATQIGIAAGNLLDSVADLSRIAGLAPAVSSAATYGTGEFPGNLRDAARILAVEPRVRIVEVDAEKFDTHAMQGNATSGPLRDRLAEIDKALGAFIDDAKRLGFWSRTVIVVISEFGRTVKENGSKGTDHGRGGVAWLAGPAAIVRGRRIIAPGTFSLAPGALFEGRDLPVTADLRALTGEVLTKHLGVTSLASVFPGWTPTSLGLLV